MHLVIVYWLMVIVYPPATLLYKLCLFTPFPMPTYVISNGELYI